MIIVLQAFEYQQLEEFRVQKKIWEQCQADQPASEENFRMDQKSRAASCLNAACSGLKVNIILNIKNLFQKISVTDMLPQTSVQ
ncbi:hypothetical protein Nmul_A2643 [Nitrosospira multiformis ATCC 25196]|uniref:Uncharacterized protein n=1 Tax=Nitrosospira multiformis (strain ATCC 25196 / NCIMB 11849 / C 71) TaxID=323848 RepID=Q2Y5P1_NITMU|nr:hypothetical protein Nmul_A2643 [Nitrosospira multiformis ATCC 25196]